MAPAKPRRKSRTTRQRRKGHGICDDARLPSYEECYPEREWVRQTSSETMQTLQGELWRATDAGGGDASSRRRFDAVPVSQGARLETLQRQRHGDNERATSRNRSNTYSFDCGGASSTIAKYCSIDKFPRSLPPYCTFQLYSRRDRQ
jgi:hypothetical protein